ncbi:MAG TPA: hypothetical protein DEA45_01845 [Acholeplasmataceae bacterium]|nr:hypothetical protein [Acholeplasmataceae bacterium]
MREKMNKQIENARDSASKIKGKLKNGDYKKISKRVGIVLVILIIVGAGAAFALEKYEETQDAKVKQAESNMIQAQAKLNNITLISENDAKVKVSEQIGIDISQITFDSISLSYLEYREDNHEDFFWNHEEEFENHDDDEDEHDKRYSKYESEEATSEQTIESKTNSMTPVYKIECSANSVEYEAVIDAASGNLYSIEIGD